jgi:hypothetical protein
MLGHGLVLMVLVSLLLAINDELQAAMAWWSSTLLLLPPLLFAFRRQFLTFRVIALIVFVTQFVTVPIFFLMRNDFELNQFKPFGFTTIEVLSIISRVTVFLIILGGFLYFWSRLTFFALPSYRNRFSQHTQLRGLRLKRSSSTGTYLTLLIGSIAALVPLNMWMFQEGLSIVGVGPPRLPFKLSGLLHYFTRYVVPLLLGYLYYKTRRNLLPATLLLLYGLVLGLTSVSRAALVFVLLPVLALAWIEKRNLVLVVTGVGLLIGYSLVSQARGFVYLVIDGTSTALTEGGTLSVIGDLIESIEPAHLDLILGAPIAVLNRIEGFENLVLSSSYDPSALEGGAFGVILRMIWRPLSVIDLDAHHIQWQGFVLPEGFVNGGALLSNVIIASNDNLIWIAVAALVTAIVLLILEKSVRTVAAKHGLPSNIEFFLICLMTIIFFIEGGGSVNFVIPLLTVLTLACLPRLTVFPTDPRNRSPK